MFWPDTQTGVDVEPARKTVQSAVRKYFTEGGVGVPPTVPGGDWFNQITNELLNVLAAAGIDPSKADDDQLLQAIIYLSAEHGDAALRQDLHANSGASLVGYGSTSVEGALSKIFNAQSPMNSPVSLFSRSLDSRLTSRVNLVPISDSFGDGVGANYENRLFRVFEAALNFSNVRGFGYMTDTRITDLVNVAGSGVITNGVKASAGALESRVILTSGQYIELTGFEANYFDIWYDGSETTGDINIELNGEVQRNFVTQKTPGIKSTFEAALFPSGTYKTDKVRFVATGGTVYVTALMPLRGPTSGPWVCKISHGGWSFKSYDSQAVVDEIASYSSFLAAYTLYPILLGTNSIYNPSEAQTPSEMTLSLQGLISKLQSKTPSCGFIIGCPPRADESIWPVIKAGFSHSDYVQAIVSFCESNHIQCIRFDKLGLYEKGLLSDGVHPNDYGHILCAKTLCDSLCIPFIPYLDPVVHSPIYGSSILYRDAWGTFLNDPGSVPFVRRYDNIGFLSGAVQQNSSTSMVVMTIPAAFRPKHRNVNVVAFDASGPKKLSILMNGDVMVDGFPDSWLSFEVSWVIDNSI